MLPEPLLVLQRLTQTFDALNIAYFVGGSVASSLHGIFRATQDIDFVADIREEQVDAFVVALEDEFYVDGDMIREAIQTRSSFNVIHLPTMVKADVFLSPVSPWAKEQWARRRQERIGQDEDAETVYLASAEDMILQKLNWYRLGGGISDRQWGDVQGMLKVQGKALEFEYLWHWAEELGLSDLLDRALGDAGLSKD